MAILVALLVVAAVVARTFAGADPDLTQEQAVAIAEEVVAFEPDGVQVRFLRQGIPSQGYWYVSFYLGTAKRPTIVQLVQIDAETGEIVDDGLRDDV